MYVEVDRETLEPPNYIPSWWAGHRPLGRGPLEAGVPTSAKDQAKASSRPRIPLLDLCDWLPPHCEVIASQGELPAVPDTRKYSPGGIVSLCCLVEGGSQWGAQVWGMATMFVLHAKGVMGAAAQWMATVAQLCPHSDSRPQALLNTQAVSSVFLNHPTSAAPCFPHCSQLLPTTARSIYSGPQPVSPNFQS